MEGSGVGKNVESAVDLLQHSANRGNYFGMYSLAYYQYHGKAEVTADPTEAVELWKKAVQSTDSPQRYGAAYRVGLAYKRGRGVALDLTGAFHWFERAANLGSDAALYEIGCALRDGRGVPADPEGARRAFEMGARFGNKKCRTALAGTTNSSGASALPFSSSR